MWNPRPNPVALRREFFCSQCFELMSFDILHIDRFTLSPRLQADSRSGCCGAYVMVLMKVMTEADTDHALSPFNTTKLKEWRDAYLRGPCDCEWRNAVVKEEAKEAKEAKEEPKEEKQVEMKLEYGQDKKPEDQ